MKKEIETIFLLSVFRIVVLMERYSEGGLMVNCLPRSHSESPNDRISPEDTRGIFCLKGGGGLGSK